MSTRRMTADERILSYLRNRKGARMTAADVAVGARLKMGTVSPQLAKLARAGLVIRLRSARKSVTGRAIVSFIAAEYYRADMAGDVVQAAPRMPYAALVRCADLLESAANAVLVSDHSMTESDNLAALNALRVARDTYRDLRDRGTRPASGPA